MPDLAVTETARFCRAVFFHLSFTRMTGLPQPSQSLAARTLQARHARERPWPIGQIRTIRHASRERVVKIAVIV
ncbi:hypothetical protein [Burkholderia lata]|uniref:hypothetical protein n=1 Tax=Burkholderia lata (strain ATCC 17760 / DSM 23089 / LMG 22485 / NCIMB 9086 / R18194 / 383) TaxID=482957 RepID=UPI00158162D4|nr:hypothetical protein [Burkholderia lata]